MEVSKALPEEGQDGQGDSSPVESRSRMQPRTCNIDILELPAGWDDDFSAW